MTREREPWFAALAEELAEAQAGLHELNEALRIAEHWRLRNEDAAEVVTRLSNGRESYLALVNAAGVAVHEAENSQSQKGDT